MAGAIYRWLFDRAAVPIASLLLIAVLLKLRTEWPLAVGLRQWVVLGQVAAELGMALWLLSGWQQNLARRLVLGVFTLFSFISGYKWFSGADSCGCFGKVTVAPWITLLIDIVVVLVATTAPVRVSTAPRWRIVSAGIGLVIAVLISWAALHDWGPSDRPAASGILKPKTWIGKPLPIFQALSRADELRHGSWTLVMFHADCERCEILLTQLLEFPPPDPERWMLVGISPADIPPVELDKRFGHDTLDRSRNWFVETPVVIRCNEGIVETVSQTR